MSEPKTKPTGASVAEFIAAVPDPKRRADAEKALALLTEVSGETALMWGPTIVGFGAYRYLGPNKKPVEWPVIGFSPRKAELVFYVGAGMSARPELLDKIGKYKRGGGCLYLKRFEDADPAALRALLLATIATMHERHEIVKL